MNECICCCASYVTVMNRSVHCSLCVGVSTGVNIREVSLYDTGTACTMVLLEWGMRAAYLDER